jgi:hypothetical protein
MPEQSAHGRSPEKFAGSWPRKHAPRLGSAAAGIVDFLELAHHTKARAAITINNGNFAFIQCYPF